ncbi:DUF5979 domain-containing protein [Nocardioides sambongensis]|uniref:DUF5979 domain-containing protein n=1 Tax=Nocardioides sambongensis TaxID=2589074 RepID=UPI00112AD418|nr:DUF5979 domain-containing protein [Nocardioides sambongensis]
MFMGKRFGLFSGASGASYRTGDATRRSVRSWLTGTLAVLLAVLGAPLLTPGTATAAPESLAIDKSVDNATPAPGEAFTYTIQVRCSEEDCLDAQITDALPPELDGFRIVNVAFTPNAIPRTVTWGPGGTETPPATVGPNTTLTVDIAEPTTTPSGTGLAAGRSYTVQISLQVPDDYPPGTSADIVNTAKVTASNANPQQASATVRIEAPVTVGVAVDKAWSDNRQTYAPGGASTIGLDARNTSNVAVDQVVLQEPKAAPAGATTLDATNPFRITDFTGFGAVSLPDGCTSVRVDAYVRTGSTWDWVTGTATATPTSLALPAGVTAAQVGGIRVTCDGDVARGTTLSVDLDLAQRSTERNTGASLAATSNRVDNTATGSVTEGSTTKTDDGSANYVVSPLVPTVEASKNIAPQRVIAGRSATATVRATNGANPVTTMHLADLDFFTSEITFGGFTGPLTWPAGATSATITYHTLDGAPATTTETVTSGQTPSGPTEPISGLEITYTGQIAAAESGGAAFVIATSVDATGTAATLKVDNTVDVDVTASNGLTDDASDTDDLTITNPSIDVTLDKTVRPSSAVQPGDPVITSLSATASATGDGAYVDSIVVEDSWGTAESCSGFWNAFDLRAIAPTQVPDSTRLLLEVQDAAGTWRQVTTYGPVAGASVFQLTQAQLAAALPTGVTVDTVRGIRFGFTDADGFPATTTVTPNVAFQARSALRKSSCPTPPANAQRTYTNTATTTADGDTGGGRPLTDSATDTGQAIVRYPSGTPGPIGITKSWNRDTVDAQSGVRPTTTLAWRLTPGYSPVRISDMADAPSAATVAQTVYDAFDLYRVEPVSASSTPFSSGWYLKYDTITRVELFNSSTGSWQTVAAPGGTWMTATRGFKGHTLTAAQRSTTIGVRLTVEELAADTAARTQAQQIGSAFDPYAPAPGSGVGAGGTNRSNVLTWELRDQKRSDGSWVVEDELYNTADAGLVDNTTRITGTPVGGGADVTATDNDTIQILDPDPGVEVEKSVNPTSDVHTPPAGSPADAYPSATWRIVASNTSTAPASYVRVTDPATCSDTDLLGCQSPPSPADAVADPFDTDVDHLTDADTPNAFERFDATAITIGASIPAQVDLTASTVWLLRYAGGSYTTEQTTAAAVNAMTAAQLSDVVGISVTYQPTAPATSGGTITQANDLSIVIVSRLRATLRSSGEPLVLRAGQTYDQVNRGYAQAYDPITSPDVRTGDVDDATVRITGGVVNVQATKAVSPDRITEPQNVADADTVRVVLGADQGTNPRSTLSPSEIVIEDQADSPDFWDSFDFAGNVAVLQMPAGADQVRADLYDGDAWVTGTAGPASALALPAVPAGEVQGVRFVFSRADGAILSSTVPAPNWTARVGYDADLRTTYRTSGEDLEFPSTIENTQTSQSFRPDGNDSEPADATDSVELVVGTHELAVNKLTNEGTRLASAGDTVPFDLTLTNNGTGFLTLDELRDTPPGVLAYNGEPAPEVTADPDGLLSEDVTVTMDGDDLVFVWPAGGDRMAPGETYKIRLWLELLPGLGAGEKATNIMVATTAEELTRCTNTVAGGSTTDDWSTDPSTCGTSDFIGVVNGPNLYTVKGVAGALEGADRPRSATACAPTLEVDGGSYYRPNCVANSQVGGTDDWALYTVNAGTVGIDEMTVFDQLPTSQDRKLVAGSSRGSTYRPELVAESLAVNAPAGTTVTTEVTTSADVCVGTWSNLVDQPVCEQSGEVWTTAGPSTDWSAVTGLRIHLDFTTADAGVLQPGEAATVTYSSRNELRSAANPDGVTRAVPVDDDYAWNQFGVKFLNTGSDRWRKIAPNQVGVHLRSGSVQVTKEITGPAHDYAAEEFLVDVACRVGSGDDAVALDLGEDATVELTEGNDHTVRIDGIPLSEQGTRCTFTEQGTVGEFGESSRSGTPVTVDVSEPTDPARPVAEQPVPTAQAVTITNDYAFTGLSLTKRIDTDATDVDLGPFGFTLSCTSLTGRAVTFDEAGTTDLAFTVAGDETWTAPADTIPVGATCTVTETDPDAADHLVVTGDNVVDNGDGSATVTPGLEPAEIEFTNGYDAGTVTLAKVVDGEGATRYGTGTFVFDVTCSYQDQTPYQGQVELLAGATLTIGPYPVGTSCTVAETATGGATSSVLDPADGVVVVPAPETAGTTSNSGAPTNVTVTATNTFDVTSLEVEKQRLGDLSAAGAQGPFTVSLECTWLVDGERQAFEVPGGAERRLTAANGYRASYGELASSAECTLTETETGDADETSIRAVVAGQSVVEEGTEATVDLSSTDGPGQARVVVTNRFDRDRGTDPDGAKRGPDGSLGGNGGLPETGAPFGRGLLILATGLLLAGLVVAVRNRRRS